MVFSLLSENHMNCFEFIHLFWCSLYQPCHQLLRFWISHTTSTVAVLNNRWLNESLQMPASH
jgi:hypothetical protein